MTAMCFVRSTGVGSGISSAESPPVPERFRPSKALRLPTLTYRRRSQDQRRPQQSPELGAGRAFSARRSKTMNPFAAGKARKRSAPSSASPSLIGAARRGLVAAISGLVVLSTAADVLMPVYAGRLVDAVALGVARPRRRARCGDPRLHDDLCARRRHGRAPASRLPRRHPADAPHDDGHRFRRFPSRAALFDRMACELLRRLDRAKDLARHVGARPFERHACWSRSCPPSWCWSARRRCWRSTGR